MFQSQPLGILLRVVLTVIFIAAADFANAATNIVTTATDDNNPGCLRRVISNSVSGDTIIFAPGLSGTTIRLTNYAYIDAITNSALVVNKSLTIDASALSGGIQIDGNHQDSVFKVTSGPSILTGLTITNGYAYSDGGPGYLPGDGGGILNSATLTLNRCSLIGNTAIANSGSTLPPAPPGHGGAGIANFGILTVNQCTIAGNVGSGIYNDTVLTVNASTLSGNGFGFQNGRDCAKYCGRSGAFATVNQCTLSGNGEAVYTVSTNPVFINQSTVSGNSIQALVGYFTVSNSIVVGNNWPYSTFTNGANNIFTTTNINLSPLGYYGGPTQTMPLQPGSPAIDGCTNGTIFTIDQRGYPRPVDGDGDTIAVADIGAVEGWAFPYGPGPFTGMKKLGDTFQFGFLANSGASYTVLASPDLTLPIEAWLNLGPILESPAGSGNYQFTDSNATNNPSRFYRVRFP